MISKLLFSLISCKISNKLFNLNIIAYELIIVSQYDIRSKK